MTAEIAIDQASKTGISVINREKTILLFSCHELLQWKIISSSFCNLSEKEIRKYPFWLLTNSGLVFAVENKDNVWLNLFLNIEYKFKKMTIK